MGDSASSSLDPFDFLAERSYAGMSDDARRIASAVGQLEVLGACDADLQMTPDDNHIKAIRARQAGVRVAREVVSSLEVLSRLERLEASNRALEAKLGGQSGGVVRVDDAPPFIVPTGSRPHKV